MGCRSVCGWGAVHAGGGGAVQGGGGAVHGCRGHGARQWHNSVQAPGAGVWKRCGGRWCGSGPTALPRGSAFGSGPPCMACSSGNRSKRSCWASGHDRGFGHGRVTGILAGEPLEAMPVCLFCKPAHPTAQTSPSVTVLIMRQAGVSPAMVHTWWLEDVTRVSHLRSVGWFTCLSGQMSAGSADHGACNMATSRSPQSMIHGSPVSRSESAT